MASDGMWKDEKRAIDRTFAASGQKVASNLNIYGCII